MVRLTYHDRRRPGRPSDGQGRLCPGCGQPTCAFNARFAFDDETVPAWVCEQEDCRYCEVLRRPSALGRLPSQATVTAAKAVQARARRTIMRSTARTTRARQRISSTKNRLRKP